jgi:hypothetical protein
VEAAATFHDGAPVDTDDVASREVFADDGERTLVVDVTQVRWPLRAPRNARSARFSLTAWLIQSSARS